MKVPARAANERSDSRRARTSAGNSTSPSQTPPPTLSTPSTAAAATAGSEHRPGRHLAPDGRDGEGREQRDQRHRDELLDRAPERVAVEERRLDGDEDDDRAGPVPADEPGEERLEAEGEHRGLEGEVRLECPQLVDAREPGPDSEGEHRADRVAGLADVGGQRAPVGRRRQVDRATVLEDVIADREPGGGVVELDVAGERRLAGEHDRCGVHGEDEEGASEGPRPRDGGSRGARARTRRRRVRSPPRARASRAPRRS